MGKWKTIDSAPEDEFVLVHYNGVGSEVAKLRSGGWFYNRVNGENWSVTPTHWQPLPEAPIDRIKEKLDEK